MHGMLGSCASGVRASSLFNRVHTRRSPQQILASLTRSRTHTAIPASGSVTMSAPSIIAESDITSTTARNSSAESSGFPSPRSTHTSQSDTPLIRQTAPQNNAQTSAENSSPGWPYVAGYMATTPEFQTFSRFRELNEKPPVLSSRDNPIEREATEARTERLEEKGNEWCRKVRKVCGGVISL
jgi:hypothetical protein